MRGKKVFVSGGAGVIGSVLVEKLLAEGAEVFVGDLKPNPFGGKVHYRQGDLNTLTSGELLAFKPDIFFHLAATFERSIEEAPFFKENFHHNVLLSHHLLQCLKEIKTVKRVVFASSYLIYNPSLYLFDAPHSPVSIKEQDSVTPRNICGAAKYFHERELQFFAELNGVSARIFRVFGRGSRDVISRWIRQALKQETLSVFRPEGCFDYIYADDVAEGLLRLAQTNYTGFINLGSGKAFQVQDVLNQLQKHLPSLKTTIEKSDIPYEASQADMSLWKEVVGWMPQENLESAIPKIIAFEKKKKNPFQTPHEGVLITSVSKKAPLIHAVRQAAKKIGQFTRIHGCDAEANSVSKYLLDGFWHCPRDEQLQPEAVIAYCKQHRLSALIPTRDGELLFYAKHRDLFENAGIRVLISSPRTIEACLDKKKFASKVPAIQTELDIDHLEAPRYVVKERFGAGSKVLGLKLSKDNARLHAQKLQSPIFQPFIEGKEYSIDAYRTKQGIVQGIVVRHRELIVDGESQITTTLRHPEMEALCRTLINALDIYGPSVLQVIETSNGTLHVLECNPRFGGASTTSIAVGLDIFYWFFLECCAQDLNDYPFTRSPQEVRQVRYAQDKLVWQ